MTRKDYEAIAEVFVGADNSLAEIKKDVSIWGEDYDYGSGFVSGHNSALEAISQGLIKVFEEDNPRFDSERFLRACGL